VPIIGFGQRIWKSQDPNEKLISKEVIINDEIFDVYLAKEYKEWKNNQYITLTEKYWYILPTQEQINKFQDTIQGYYVEDYWQKYSHLVFLDGSIENGHYWYKNGQIESITVMDQFWCSEDLNVLSERYDRDHKYFPIDMDIVTDPERTNAVMCVYSESLSLKYSDQPILQILCNDNGECYKELKFNYISSFTGYNQDGEKKSRDLDELYPIMATPTLIQQDFIDLAEDFEIIFDCNLGEYIDDGIFTSGYINIGLGIELDYSSFRSKKDKYFWKMIWPDDLEQDIDYFTISKAAVGKRSIKGNYLEVNRRRKGIILKEKEKSNLSFRNAGRYNSDEKKSSFDITIKKIEDNLFLTLNGKLNYMDKFLSYSSNNILVRPDLSYKYFGNPSTTVKEIIMRQYIDLSENKNNIGDTYSEWTGNGSGFFISTSGYIVTNNHVIEDANEIEVEYQYKNKRYIYKVEIVKKDPSNDLAILRIIDPSFKSLSFIPYNLKTRSSDIGANVFALGYPKALSGMGKDIKFTDGRISSKTGFNGDIRVYQTTTPIQGGNSGGPLFDFNGNLIGINSAKLVAEDVEGVSYSIKASYLNNLMDVLPETISVPSNTSLSNKSLEEQIKILSDYVVLIKVK